MTTERKATIVLIAFCLVGSLAYAIYIPFKVHATDLDALTAGACILAAIVSARELWAEMRKLQPGEENCTFCAWCKDPKHPTHRSVIHS